MKNLNKKNIKSETAEMILDDDLDYSISVFKNLRKDLLEVFKNYASFDSENFKLNLKVLKNSKILLLVDLEIDGLFLSCHKI